MRTIDGSADWEQRATEQVVNSVLGDNGARSPAGLREALSVNYKRTADNDTV